MPLNKSLNKNTLHQYICEDCRHPSFKWTGQCVNCRSWNSLSSLAEYQKKEATTELKNIPVSLPQFEKSYFEKIITGISEFDRVIGGGIVEGSFTLISGGPGVGKSTMLLEICSKIASKSQGVVLYISGEEQVEQIAYRAQRLGIQNKNIQVVHESNLQKIIEIVSFTRPKLLVIDSVQTILSDESGGSSGSVAQMKEVTFELVKYTKSIKLTTLLIGHVNKEGNIAGPKTLEHMVDTVIHMECENELRILRSSKNRFGSLSEVGIMQMSVMGLEQKINLTQNLIHLDKGELSGRCITSFPQGSRNIFLEVQALVTKNILPHNKIICQGVDSSRVSLLVAVMDKHLRLGLLNHNIYINITGGMKLKSRSGDFAILVAILSSFYNKYIVSNSIFVGEVGLCGEVRCVILGESLSKDLQSIELSNIYGAKEQNIAKNNKLNIVPFKHISELKNNELFL